MTFKWRFTRDCDSGWFCASLTPSWVAMSILPSLLQSSWIHFLSRRGWWLLQLFWEPLSESRSVNSHPHTDPILPGHSEPHVSLRLAFTGRISASSPTEGHWEEQTERQAAWQDKRSASARKPMRKTAYSAVRRAKKSSRSAGRTLTVTKLSVEQTLPGSCV